MTGHPSGWIDRRTLVEAGRHGHEPTDRQSLNRKQASGEDQQVDVGIVALGTGPDWTNTGTATRRPPRSTLSRAMS
jgi:hypothetical protein